MPHTIPTPLWRMQDILGVLLIVLGLLVGTGCFTVIRSVEADAAARGKSRETITLLEAGKALLADLARTESAQRGYLLTGSAQFLDDHRIARQETEQDLARLDGLARNPGGMLPDVRRMVVEKIEEMARTIELAGSGAREEALAILREGQGRRTMQDIRVRIDAMSEAQQQELERNYAFTDASQMRLRWQLGVIVAASLGALLLAAVAMRRSAQAAAEARYLGEIKAQRDRADLVRRELSHRVKNLFAVIMSIVSTTGRAETDPREAARKTRERIQALARAHALSSGQSELRDAKLGDLVAAVAGPYAPPEHPLEIEGPDVVLPAQIVTPLGLIINELATNALKYGGWSGPSGTVRVVWQFITPDELDFRWTESGIPPNDRDDAVKGFGTTMIDLSAEQAGARLSRKWSDEAFELTMKFAADRLGIGMYDKDRGLSATGK